MTRFAPIAVIAAFSFIISTSAQAFYGDKANTVYCKSGNQAYTAKGCKENGGSR